MIFKLTQYRLKQLYYIYNIYPVEFKQKKRGFLTDYYAKYYRYSILLSRLGIVFLTQ